MCDRYYRRSDKQKIAQVFNASKVDDFSLPPWDYNVAPITMQPIIRDDRDTGERELVVLRWGLIPFFITDAFGFRGYSTINAEAEKVHKSANFREPFKKRRCLVPASGFYMWLKVDAKEKQPFAFELLQGKIMAFAGLWDAWKDLANGKWIQTYTIITSDANQLVADVSGRMPVILRPSDFDRWLDCKETHPQPDDLLRPFPADEMEAFEVSKDVSNVGNNSESLLSRCTQSPE